MGKLSNFFKNKELNHFYISVAIMQFGIALIAIFIPIYLYTIGYPIQKIILFYFLASLYYIFISYFCAKIVSNIGSKHSMLISAPFAIASFLGLNYLKTNPKIFMIIPLFLAIYWCFYWYGYHLNYLKNSNKKNRGKEVSFMHSIRLTMAAIAPFIGGLIASYNFTYLYITGSVLIFLGTIPLFLEKENYQKIKFTFMDVFSLMAKRKKSKEFLTYTGYSIDAIINLLIWPIFLIITLASIKITGLIVSLSMIASLILLYFMGKLTDKTDKTKLIKKLTIFHSLSWIFRIFATGAKSIFVIDSYRNLTEKAILIPWTTQSYNHATKTKFFHYIVSRDTFYHTIRVIFLSLLIPIFYFPNPFTITFIIGAIASLGYYFMPKE